MLIFMKHYCIFVDNCIKKNYYIFSGFWRCQKSIWCLEVMMSKDIVYLFPSTADQLIDLITDFIAIDCFKYLYAFNCCTSHWQSISKLFLPKTVLYTTNEMSEWLCLIIVPIHYSRINKFYNGHILLLYVNLYFKTYLIFISWSLYFCWFSYLATLS